ncbi:MAG: Crp/Fnr family transcriptional regulator [Nitrospiraceae bacterium]|nr:Crp/Fnr family transcriptional regulator [Nitrospiraceae bacterium]
MRTGSVQKDRFLALFPAFGEGPERFFLADRLLETARPGNLPAGALIYSEGDPCSSIAFVLSGAIRVYKAGENGREITLYEIGPGETCILNASCILSGLSYPANAVTIEETEALLVPASSFRSLMRESEAMRDFVFSLVSSRLSSVMALVEEVAFGKMDERIYEYIKERAADGVLNTTHQKIADGLGTSREVVSRILKDFERKGRASLSRSSIRLL